MAVGRVRSSYLSNRGSDEAPPLRLKNTPNTHRIAPKWPRGRGLRSVRYELSATAIFLRLTAIIDFSSPHGNQFSLRLTAIIDFFLCLRAIINFSSPHGDIRIFLRLTAISIFFSPHGDIDFFSSPHGDNRFFLRLTAIIKFSSPHGDNQFFLRLMAIIDFFFASRR